MGTPFHEVTQTHHWFQDSERPLSGWGRDCSCLPISILPLSSAGEHCELELSRRQSKSLKLSSVLPEGAGNDWSSNGNLDYELTQDRRHMPSRERKGACVPKCIS